LTWRPPFPGFFSLLGLLDREDWPALVCFLEDRVIKRGRYRPGEVRLLAQAYLLLGEPLPVLALENGAAAVNPGLLEQCALLFGAARLLAGDNAGAARFFTERESRVRYRDRAWVAWYRGFALFMDNRYGEAADSFSQSARGPAEPLCAGLAAWFLADSLALILPDRSGELSRVAGEGRARARLRLRGRAAWDRAAGRLRGGPQGRLRGGPRREFWGLIAGKYLDETASWLYNNHKELH
jgi:hypothetical protein